MRTIYRYKSKAIAVILTILVGPLGIHRFYLGHPAIATTWLTLALALILINPADTWLLTVFALVDAINIMLRKRAWFRRVHSEIDDGAETA